MICWREATGKASRRFYLRSVLLSIVCVNFTETKVCWKQTIIPLHARVLSKNLCQQKNPLDFLLSFVFLHDSLPRAYVILEIHKPRSNSPYCLQGFTGFSLNDVPICLRGQSREENRLKWLRIWYCISILFCFRENARFFPLLGKDWRSICLLTVHQGAAVADKQAQNLQQPTMVSWDETRKYP